MRKPIQLVPFEGYLYAVCDDGTIWVLNKNNTWSRIVPIPGGPKK